MPRLFCTSFAIAAAATAIACSASPTSSDGESESQIARKPAVKTRASVRAAEPHCGTDPSKEAHLCGVWACKLYCPTNYVLNSSACLCVGPLPDAQQNCPWPGRPVGPSGECAVEPGTNISIPDPDCVVGEWDGDQGYCCQRLHRGRDPICAPKRE